MNELQSTKYALYVTLSATLILSFEVENKESQKSGDPKNASSHIKQNPGAMWPKWLVWVQIFWGIFTSLISELWLNMPG